MSLSFAQSELVHGRVLRVPDWLTIFSSRLKQADSRKDIFSKDLLCYISMTGFTYGLYLTLYDWIMTGFTKAYLYSLYLDYYLNISSLSVIVSLR